MVVADDSARAEFVAADLLAQAEHDTQAQAILVTSSRALAEAVVRSVETQLLNLSRRQILEKSLAASRCIVVPDIETAIAVANDYAAEHLILEVLRSVVVRHCNGSLDVRYHDAATRRERLLEDLAP